jgi:chromosome segregation ATPase
LYQIKLVPLQLGVPPGAASMAGEAAAAEARVAELRSELYEVRSELKRAEGESLDAQMHGAADVELRVELENINKQLVEEALACTEVEKTMQKEIRQVRQRLAAAEHECAQAGQAAAAALAEVQSHKEEAVRLRDEYATAASDRDLAMAEAARLRPMEGETKALREEVALIRTALEDVADLEGSLREGRAQLETVSKELSEGQLEARGEIETVSEQLRGEVARLSADAENERASLRREYQLLQDSARRIASVGLYKLNSVYHELERAWFSTLGT